MSAASTSIGLHVRLNSRGVHTPQFALFRFMHNTKTNILYLMRLYLYDIIHCAYTYTLLDSGYTADTPSYLR